MERAKIFMKFKVELLENLYKVITFKIIYNKFKILKNNKKKQ